jgi:hypothetical protein
MIDSTPRLGQAVVNEVRRGTELNGALPRLWIRLGEICLKPEEA